MSSMKIFHNVLCLSLWFVLVLVQPGPSVAGEVHKWVDESGKVHYGDAFSMQGRKDTVELDITSYDQVTISSAKTLESSLPGRVVMYSTDWCGYCKQARNYFERSGIDYREYDIEKDTAARRAYRKLGARGVPVILVGDKRMNGFSVSRFNKIYRRIN